VKLVIDQKEYDQLHNILCDLVQDHRTYGEFLEAPVDDYLDRILFVLEVERDERVGASDM
jgi:hypothetical protein